MYYWLTEHANETQRSRIDYELELPLWPDDEGIQGGTTGTEGDTWEKAFQGMQM